jgi:hypothetical protein
MLRLAKSQSVPGDFIPHLADAGGSVSAPHFEPSRQVDRNTQRFDRDVARGYTINVKQVVLAFAVEFWIIGLIVVGTYLLVTENDPGHGFSREALSALLLPAALAMVELARVPLAIAVRTQDAWHIKLLAAIGVLAAITVTSFSLSQIAWKTFDIRIAEAMQAGDRLSAAKTNQVTLSTKRNLLEQDRAQKLDIQKTINDRLARLEDQYTKINIDLKPVCTPKLGPDNAPIMLPNGMPARSCTQSSTVNQKQLDALNAEITGTKKELEIAKIAVKQTDDDIKKLDPKLVEEELTAAETHYRQVVNKSQLHSFAAMLMGKAVSQVTESEVKAIEKYLVLIPSIAAAFASTLIAITAVRRIRQTVTALPDDAAAYLFGPLLAGIKVEAQSILSDSRGRPSVSAAGS